MHEVVLLGVALLLPPGLRLDVDLQEVVGLRVVVVLLVAGVNGFGCPGAGSALRCPRVVCIHAVDVLAQDLSCGDQPLVVNNSRPPPHVFVPGRRAAGWRSRSPPKSPAPLGGGYSVVEGVIDVHKHCVGERAQLGVPS